MKDRIIAVLLVIGVIACAYLGLQTTDHAPEQEALRTQITEIRETLDSLSMPSLDLKNELAAARTALETERLTLPLAPNSNDVVNTLIAAGAAHGVTVVPLTTNPWEIDESEDQNFRVFELRATLSGELNPILDLIEEIEAGIYGGLVLSDLTLESAAADPSSYSANVIFRIYARHGAEHE